MDNRNDVVSDQSVTPQGPADAEQSASTYTALHARMGIERQVSEVFTVGEYRYSKLDDAVAQARRVAR